MLLRCLSIASVFSIMWICSEASGQSVSVLQPFLQNCMKGKFYSKDSNSCVPCSRCDYFSAEVLTCNTTSDTVCHKCLKDTGTPNRVFKNPTCRKWCRPCGPGKYVKRACKVAKSRKTQCGKCQKGSFSVMTSYAPYCVPCTDCGHMEEVSPCTATRDAVCGNCKPGFYRDSARNTCFKCHLCLSGQKEIEECRGGADGKLCSGFYFSPIRMRPLYLEDTDNHNTTSASTSQTTTKTSAPRHDLDEQRSSFEDTILTTLILTVAAVCAILLIILIAILGFKLTAMQTKRHGTRVIRVQDPEKTTDLENYNATARHTEVKDTKEQFIELMSGRKMFSIASFNDVGM